MVKFFKLAIQNTLKLKKESVTHTTQLLFTENEETEPGNSDQVCSSCFLPYEGHLRNSVL